MSDETLDLDEPEAGGAKAPKGKQKAAKPSFFGGIGGRISGFFAGLFRPELINLKNAGLGLIILLAIWLLLANLSPVRVVLWFWAVDVPKLLLFVVNLALGALLMWLWLRFRARSKAAGGGEGGQ